MNEHDEYLRLVLDYLKTNWLNPNTGIVAAGIFLSKTKYVLATSTLQKQGVWNHAEYNAFKRYEKVISNDYSNSTLVITLSPCLFKNQKSRNGISCSELILKRNFKSIFVGFIDEKQAPQGYTDYQKIDLEFEISHHEKNTRLCKDLYSLFDRFGTDINDNLLDIKKAVYSDVFK